MKGGKYAKTLAKTQARGTFRIRDFPENCFTQIYKDLYGDAMLVPIRMGTNMADGNQPETSVTEFCYKSVELRNIKVILFLIHEQFR